MNNFEIPNQHEGDEEHIIGEYKRLSRAVGIINNGKVDHTR